MFIEERVIDGVLHVRYSPDSEFKPYTAYDLTQRIIKMTKLIQDLSFYSAA